MDFPKPPFIPFVRLKVEGADNELHVATGAHGSDEAEIDTLHDNMMYPNIYIPNKEWQNQIQDVGCKKQN